MNGVLGLGLGARALIVAGVVSLGGLGVSVSIAQAPSAQGVWRNADTTLRVVLKQSEARALFVEIGAGARGLGFKPGDTSFVATVMENYVHGYQTIRYTGKCHPNGRQVPMIGRLTPDGRTLAVHYYFLAVDPNCRDTGEYAVRETLWQRVAAR